MKICCQSVATDGLCAEKALILRAFLRGHIIPTLKSEAKTL